MFRHQRKTVSAPHTRAKVVHQCGHDRAMVAEGRAMNLADRLRIVGSFLPDLHADAPYRRRTSRSLGRSCNSGSVQPRSAALRSETGHRQPVPRESSHGAAAPPRAKEQRRPMLRSMDEPTNSASAFEQLLVACRALDERRFRYDLIVARQNAVMLRVVLPASTGRSSSLPTARSNASASSARASKPARPRSTRYSKSSTPETSLCASANRAMQQPRQGGFEVPRLPP